MLPIGPPSGLPLGCVVYGGALLPLHFWRSFS